MALVHVATRSQTDLRSLRLDARESAVLLADQFGLLLFDERAQPLVLLQQLAQLLLVVELPLIDQTGVLRVPVTLQVQLLHGGVQFTSQFLDLVVKLFDFRQVGLERSLLLVALLETLLEVELVLSESGDLLAHLALSLLTSQQLFDQLALSALRRWTGQAGNRRRAGLGRRGALVDQIKHVLFAQRQCGRQTVAHVRVRQFGV